jgi:hypothetical protein
VKANCVVTGASCCCLKGRRLQRLC